MAEFDFFDKNSKIYTELNNQRFSKLNRRWNERQFFHIYSFIQCIKINLRERYYMLYNKKKIGSVTYYFDYFLYAYTDNISWDVDTNYIIYFCFFTSCCFCAKISFSSRIYWCFEVNNPRLDNNDLELGLRDRGKNAATPSILRVGTMLALVKTRYCLTQQVVATPRVHIWRQPSATPHTPPSFVLNKPDDGVISLPFVGLVGGGESQTRI